MQRRTGYALLLLSLLVPALLATAEEPAVTTTPGALQVERDDGTLVEMPLEHTAVTIDVSAFVSRVSIEQTFANPFDHPVEAVYTFPLGDRAAVDDFELVVGERTIRGELHRREEAREIYETARAHGYRAALLEQERPNIFTQSVANLEPGHRIKVRIRTVETLRYEGGVYQLTFPLVVGPRYIPGGRAGSGPVATTPVPPTPAVPDADRITPPVLRPGFRSGHDVAIAVSLDAGVPIGGLASPSHRILVERAGRSGALVRLDPRDTIPNKDFILRWDVSSEKPAVGLLAHRSGLDGFFTLLVQPKGEVTVLEAAPKEIVLVLDTSGSMRGVPLEALKRFVQKALRTLGPRDTFNLIRFAGGAETLAEQPMRNDETSIQRALQWVQQLRGSGGTELMAGFRAAFARPPDPDRVRLVIFLTDGYIGNEQQILGAIGGVLGEARIHTLGIGSSVNHYLLDRMAELGRGSYVFIRPDENAGEAVDRFRGWVTRPYLTDLEIDWGALPVTDMVPDRPRDLFSGQTLTVVGRYLAGARGTVTVRGRLGGSYWEQRIDVELPGSEPRHAPLASLWARHRIEDLLMSSPGGVTRSIRAEVIALALEYRLMTEFTSFVAVDDSVVVNPGGESETVRQALPVPDGVSFEGVFGPQGPAVLRTGEDLEIVLEDAIVLEQSHARSAPPRGPVIAGSSIRVVKKYVPPPAPRAMPVPAEQLVAANASTPVPGRLYRTQVTLAPGATAESKRVPGSPPRHYKTIVSGGVSHVDPLTGKPMSEVNPNSIEEMEAIIIREEALRRAGSVRIRLLETAFRVLADLADDGRLAAAEGRPSLAALLAAQTPAGAVSRDVIVQSVATWALIEASATLPDDPWVREAARKAEAHLAGLAIDGGWPAEPGSDQVDGESTRWARLVLRRVGSTGVTEAATPPDNDASVSYRRLRAALAAAGTGAGSGDPEGRTPFDRLVHAIGRGHLRMAARNRPVGSPS